MANLVNSTSKVISEAYDYYLWTLSLSGKNNPLFIFHSFASFLFYTESPIYLQILYIVLQIDHVLSQLLFVSKLHEIKNHKWAKTHGNIWKIFFLCSHEASVKVFKFIISPIIYVRFYFFHPNFFLQPKERTSMWSHWVTQSTHLLGGNKLKQKIYDIAHQYQNE